MGAASSKPAGEVSLLDYFLRVRAYTERLCRPLEVEDYIPQPSLDVSPPKWNIAHTTWFFEEMVLKPFVPGYKVFDPHFGFLFNSYYNTVGERSDRAKRGDLSRPTVTRVFEYRKYVDQAMADVLSGPVLDPVLIETVILGLNHEQQHQELFITDLKFTLSRNPLFPVYDPAFLPASENETPTSSLVKCTEGVYEIGFQGEGFSFDNEHARHKVFLNEFSIADQLVTNAEYREFIDDGGYRDHRFWHSEGWDWIQGENVDRPLYWHIEDGEHLHFTLGGLQALPMNDPVCHVSFYEASAFAEWKGMRLPTEFEWEAAQAKFHWGHRWEWTGSAYLPYPGFRKPDGAVGEYNGKFMINQMVLRGASVVTPQGHSRPTYRNFFHPHLRWQYTGIRLAEQQSL